MNTASGVSDGKISRQCNMPNLWICMLATTICIAAVVVDGWSLTCCRAANVYNHGAAAAASSSTAAATVYIACMCCTCHNQCDCNNNISNGLGGYMYTCHVVVSVHHGVVGMAQPYRTVLLSVLYVLFVAAQYIHQRTKLRSVKSHE